MNRIQQAWADDIAVALSLTSAFGFEAVDFLCGVDPLWAGLHRFEEASYGRSYRSTAHVAYRFHASDGRPTVVLPIPEHWSVVVHELGHILDERQDFRWSLPPVSDYAKTTRDEAFASAFTTWVFGPEQPDEWVKQYDIIARWETPAERIFLPQ